MAWDYFRSQDDESSLHRYFHNKNIHNYQYYVGMTEGNGFRYQEDHVYKLHLPKEDMEKLFFKHEMNLTLRVRIK